MSKDSTPKPFVALSIAVLTVSDTRDEASDTSGQLLVEKLASAGHRLHEKRIVKDDIYHIRAVLSAWIADAAVQAVVVTGGTGFSGRDSTPEAVRVLFDKDIEGFGEVFRHYSLAEIGTSTLQSRALAGLANNTVIFCVPGSTNACRTAWDRIIGEQLDNRHRPCNFVPHLKQSHCETSRG
jgi:molybdenum cofactor biosynthesis protein B